MDKSIDEMPPAGKPSGVPLPPAIKARPFSPEKPLHANSYAKVKMRCYADMPAAGKPSGIAPGARVRTYSPSRPKSAPSSGSSSRQSVSSNGSQGKPARQPMPPDNQILKAKRGKISMCRFGQKFDKVQLSSNQGDEDDDKYNYDGTFFTSIRGHKKPWFTVDPEWVSENLSVSKMTLQERRNRTMTFPTRRCRSAPPPRNRNPITWEW